MGIAGQMDKIGAVDAGDNSEGKGDGGKDAEDFHDLVHVVGH